MPVRPSRGRPAGPPCPVRVCPLRAEAPPPEARAPAWGLPGVLPSARPAAGLFAAEPAEPVELVLL